MRKLSVPFVSILVLTLIPGSTKKPRDLTQNVAGTVAGIAGTNGKITLLRVQGVDQVFGPPGDRIDVEVIFCLDSDPSKAYGFQLRDDANRSVREGMLDLLRDAFENDWTVHVAYRAESGQDNSIVIRLWAVR